MIPYLPDSVFMLILERHQTSDFNYKRSFTRIQNRINRWFNIYFPEYKTVYGKPDAKSGILILKEAPLPRRYSDVGY